MSTAESEMSQLDGPRSLREILLEVRDDVREIKLDQATMKRVIFGAEDRAGLVARVAALEERMRLIGWVGGVFAVLLAALLFQIFTGQVRIVIP